MSPGNDQTVQGPDPKFFIPFNPQQVNIGVLTHSIAIYHPYLNWSCLSKGGLFVCLFSFGCMSPQCPRQRDDFLACYFSQFFFLAPEGHMIALRLQHVVQVGEESAE